MSRRGGKTEEGDVRHKRRPDGLEQRSGTLLNLDFERGISAPCCYYYKKRRISLVVHVDDIAATGSKKELTLLSEELRKKYDLDFKILGLDHGECKQGTYLGRTITWTTHGLHYGADRKHVKLLLRDFGMEKCSPVNTPGPTEAEVKGKRGEVALNEKDGRAFRGMVARINYLSPDRPDLAFASKCWPNECPHHRRANRFVPCCSIPCNP